METLYDLLGALPRDDAEGLRTAFRKAVKGAHPDLRPDDPYAALKFREIVRANEILGDPEQRASYDHLLALAHLEQESASDYAVAARIHKLASGVLALAGASVVTVGGYLLFMHMSAASIAPASNLDVAFRASTEIAAVSLAGSAEALRKSASSARTGIPADAIVPGAATSQSSVQNAPAAKAGPAPDLAASGAASLRAQGIAAYRNGDLKGAIAYLDQAIQLDPKFLAAYIDRGTILYRLRKFDRAFADIAPAKRIDKTGHAKSMPTIAPKQHIDHAAIAPAVTPAPPRRTAAQDPSRGEGFMSVTVR